MSYISEPTFDDYDGILAYLDYDYARWNATQDLGVNAVITYSFAEGGNLPTGNGPYGIDGWDTFDTAQRDSFRDALSQIEDLAGLRFVEVDEGGLLNAMIGENGEGISGYAYYPAVGAFGTIASDIVMVYEAFADAGTFSYYVMLHEIGHALGLSHSHTGDHKVGDTDDVDDNTVMTYNVDNTPPTQYGSFDIAALGHLYGDTSKSQNWDISEKPDGRILIKTTNGDDSLFTVNRDSVVRAYKGNDEVFGRDGNDKIFGNRGADLLVGGKGEDKLIGGRGSDILIGGEGTDKLTGGIGADVFVFTHADRGTRDRIKDFTQGDDIIDLSAFDLQFADLTFQQAPRGHLEVSADDLDIFIKYGRHITFTENDFTFGDILLG